jgi:hypothetical protein
MNGEESEGKTVYEFNMNHVQKKKDICYKKEKEQRDRHCEAIM